MKLLLTTLAAAALLAGPALAQDHTAHHHPAGDKPMDMDMDKMTPAQMHAHCKAMMGGKMQGRPAHDHSADKLGHAPRATPPTEAEMKKMHEKCSAHMDAAKPEQAAPKK